MLHTTVTMAPTIKNSGKFLINRFSRIFSLYYGIIFILILSLVSIAFCNHSINLHTISLLGVLHTIHLPKEELLQLLTVWWKNPSDKFLLVRWTLTFELYFYIVFTFILFFTKKHRILAIFLWCFIMTILFPLLLHHTILSHIQTQIPSYLFHGLTNMIIWNFFLGAVASLYYKKITRIPTLLSLFLLGSWILAFTYYAFFFKPNTFLPIISSPFIRNTLFLNHSVVSSILMFWLLLACIANQKIILAFSPRLFIYFGSISYSIYLVHWLFMDLIGHSNFDKANVFLVIALVFLTSHYTHKYLEVKLGMAIRNKLLKLWESRFRKKSFAQ